MGLVIYMDFRFLPCLLCVRRLIPVCKKWLSKEGKTKQKPRKQTNLHPVTTGILLIGNGSGRLVTVYRFVLNQELDWP